MARGRRRGWVGWVVAVAVCLVASAVGAQGDPMESASPADQAAAKQKFIVAKQAFEQGRFDEALSGFRESYALVASPNSHLMVVNTLVEMHRLSEAYAEASAVIVEAERAVAAGFEKYATARDAAQATQRSVRGRIGLVTIDAPRAGPEAALVVNGRALDRAEWGKPVPVEAGTVIVVLASPRGEERKEVALAAGGEATVTLGVPPPPPPAPAPEPAPAEPPSDGFDPFDQGDDQRLTAYVAGGVGATGFLLFAVFGGLHLSQYADLEDRCPGGRCPPELAEDADTGRTFQTTANVSLVVGLVGLTAGAALFFTTDWFMGDDADESSEGALARRPAITVGPGAVGVRGRF